MRYELTERPAVGGFITHSAVTREGIEMSVIHEWPDYVGRPIDASRPGLSVTWDGAGSAARDARRAGRMPRPQDIDWALAKSERQEVFDKRFGAGAYARELLARRARGEDGRPCNDHASGAGAVGDRRQRDAGLGAR